MFFPFLPFPIIRQVPFFSAEGFSPQQIVRNARDRAESAIAKKLPGTKSVFYMRAGNRGRLFFRYSKEKKGAVEKLAESNKDKEQEVIDNLKQNYE